MGTAVICRGATDRRRRYCLKFAQPLTIFHNTIRPLDPAIAAGLRRLLLGMTIGLMGPRAIPAWGGLVLKRLDATRVVSARADDRTDLSQRNAGFG